MTAQLFALFAGSFLGTVAATLAPLVAKRIYWYCTCVGTTVEVVTVHTGDWYDRCCKCRKRVKS